MIGTLDDRYGMPASVRLAMHFVSVLIMVFGAGLSVQNIGDPCEWFFRIFNAGPDTAENISLLFFLPTGLEFLGDSNCQAVSAGLVICDISNTQPGVLRTGLIEFTATSELPVGLITVSAQVVSDTFDPNLDNNFAADVGEATEFTDDLID